MSTATTSSCFPVAVSSPGGAARQYRVQYHKPAESDWHLYATFRSRDEAEDCEKQLQQRGLESRVVAFSLCPTAG